MSGNAWGGWVSLTEAQANVARRVIERESRLRSHVVVYLSGAHAYGFPSPDSDLDIKCVHTQPTDALLGMHAPETSAELTEGIDGVDIDYGSNEVAQVLRGLVSGNGNFLERVLGVTVLWASTDLPSLRELAPHFLSRRFSNHYRGFADRQRRLLVERPSVKRALYVMRTALTGAHLMTTGEVVTDVNVLFARWGLRTGQRLVERKRLGERTPLESAELANLASLVDTAFTAFEESLRDSPLPAEPTGVDAVDTWLRSFRRSRL